MNSSTSVMRHSWRAHAVLAASAAAALLGTVTVAHAAATPAAPSVTVRYGDLNLTSEQGNLRLYQRIVAAAQQVCGHVDLRDLAAYAATKACERHAVEQAVSTVNSRKLAAIHSAHVRQG